jgi:dihydroorotase
MNKTITINSPLDMHLHLREGDMLKKVAKYTSKYFSGALVMPNLINSITTKNALLDYKNNINELSKNDNFEPFMTLFFQDDYTRTFLEDIKDDILAIKLYPSGITTNSENGVKDLKSDKMIKILNIMSELNITLSIHGESNGFVMDREKEFLEFFDFCATKFPKLKIIMEHITTKDSVDFLNKFDNVFATITLHHLLITLDDVAGDMLKPHLFCKPIAKRYEDRDALLEASLNHKKVMFGSDSAPHPIHKKEACGCAAGVFSSPIAIPKLVEIFDNHNKLDKLDDFISLNARRIYNLKPIDKNIILEKKSFIVPDKYDDIVVFCSGEEIKWSII